MATEIRNRRATGPAVEAVAVTGVEVSEPFRVTSRSGIFLPDPDQAYFWTDEWQKGEREADEDIAAGRLISFDSADDLLDYFRELK